MFEKIESLPKIDKDDYKQIVLDLRTELIVTQQRLRSSKCSFPAMLVFAGVDGAGKHETVDLLNEWMDPRWLETHAYDDLDERDKNHPEYWRYWCNIPQKGEISFFLSAWYSKPLLSHVKHSMSDNEFMNEIEHINQFERTLSDNGAMIFKFWMHLDKEKQLDRLEELSKNPLTSWQIKATDWENVGMYEDFIKSSEVLISETSTDLNPWLMIDGASERSRTIAVARHFVDAVNKRLDQLEKKKAVSNEKIKAFASGYDFLSKLDMSKHLSNKDDYEKRLIEGQARLHKLSQNAYRNKRSIVVVFEGSDAAGKGGTIRRITKGLDARQYNVKPIGVPTKEELDHHYLWRFWNQLPADGRIIIFDRSWYGRVLVERIEGYASDKEWKQAFREINEFEKQLIAHGTIVVKFWLQVSKEEQHRRFKERESISYKKWKLTDEDWRNREKWDQYQIAINDMIELCQSKECPWILIPSNSKKFARVTALESLCEHLESELHK